MADVSIANLPALVGATGTADLLAMVDVSDTSESPLGTTKRISFTQLINGGGGPATFSPSVTVTGPPATGQVGLNMQTNGVNRWKVRVSGNPESGANAGSDFVVESFDDAGVALDQPFFIPRAPTGTLLVSRRTRFTAGAGVIDINHTAAAPGAILYIQLSRQAVASGYIGADASDNLALYSGAGSFAMVVDRTTARCTFNAPTVMLANISVQSDTASVTCVNSLGHNAPIIGMANVFSLGTIDDGAMISFRHQWFVSGNGAFQSRQDGITGIWHFAQGINISSQPVTFGAPNSGGAGFRQLIVPN